MAKRRKAKTKTVVKFRTRNVKVAPRRRGKKSMVAKIRKFALPIGAVGSFVAPYLRRSQQSGQSVPDLLKEDVTNFNSGEAMARVKAHIPQIVAPIGAGVLVKESRILGKYSGVAGEFLLGVGIGTAAKAVLDPPYMGTPVKGGAAAADIPTVAAGEMVSVQNPYGVVY